MKVKCAICKTEVEEGTGCELCGVAVCSSHSDVHDDYHMCDYCLGRDSAFRDRDGGDFAGTEM